ncbi:MAG: integrin alpha, partial [Planctomycetes bacterium]|nr:integrin alpha [Planctomycetota bacterium]
MNGFIRLRTCLGCLLALGAVAGLVVAVISCSTAPTPFLVAGPGVTGDDPPSLTIIEPITHVTVGRGENVLIRWIDSDRDSNALISFVLVDTAANDEVVLVRNIPENDTVGPDSFTASTALLSVGTYNLVGVIDDGVNPATTVYAETTGATVTQRVVITIVEPGQGPPTQPPTVTVIEPAFNLSVSQEDELLVVVRPTEAEPAVGVTPAYDPDSDATLYILLDLDKDPNNDDPANPDPTQIISLQQRLITQGEINDITFSIIVDLSEIEPRDDGEPYYIRATIDDATNPRVHQYAVGSISVAQLAAGNVDLYDVGRTVSGARFYGFNPGAYVGSSASGVGDFDADGVDDFVLVAQYGNPRNFGRIGEAYLVYGQVLARDGAEPTGLRFGGALAVNTISETIPGVIFEAPPLRNSFGTIPSSDARTDGISDVDFVPDLTGDGRPELLFGLRHVHGAIETTDFDPGDSTISEDDTTVNVEIEFTSGAVRVTLDDELDSSTFYAGIDDLTINSADPNTTTGSEGSLSWQDNGAGRRQWALIKFRNILEYIPDDPRNIDIASVTATLTFRVFGLGGDGAVHQCLTDFDERTTFSSFAVGGGEPQGGQRNDPTADYVGGDG